MLEYKTVCIYINKLNAPEFNQVYVNFKKQIYEINIIDNWDYYTIQCLYCHHTVGKTLIISVRNAIFLYYISY
jgi:hypothetical protein